MFGVGVYPEWANTAERKQIAYMEEMGICHRIMHVPKKAEFNFWPPDFWTGEKSTYNEGNDTHWGVEFYVVANAAGWQKYYDKDKFEEEMQLMGIEYFGQDVCNGKNANCRMYVENFMLSDIDYTDTLVTIEPEPWGRDGKQEWEQKFKDQKKVKATKSYKQWESKVENPNNMEVPEMTGEWQEKSEKRLGKS